MITRNDITWSKGTYVDLRGLSFDDYIKLEPILDSENIEHERMARERYEVWDLFGCNDGDICYFKHCDYEYFFGENTKEMSADDLRTFIAEPKATPVDVIKAANTIIKLVSTAVINDEDFDVESVDIVEFNGVKFHKVNN